jgi:hypothetical protein
MPAPLFGRIVLIGLLALFIFSLSRLVVAGRRMATNGRSPELLERHTMWSTGLLCTMVCTLAWLEIVMQLPAFKAQPVSNWLLWWVHLPFAMTFLAIFLAMKFNISLNGLGNPGLHRKLVRIIYVCLTVVFPTGFVLVWQMW